MYPDSWVMCLSLALDDSMLLQQNASQCPNGESNKIVSEKRKTVAA